MLAANPAPAQPAVVTMGSMGKRPVQNSIHPMAETKA